MWLAAMQAVAGGQSYEIGNRKLTRVDAADIEKMFDKYDAEVDRINAGRRKGARVIGVTPRNI